MPLYTALCHECGSSHSYFKRIADRLDTPECCGVKTEKQLDTPMVSYVGEHKVGHMAYDSKGEGTWISDSTQRNAWMKANNKIDASEGRQEAEHQRKSKKAADEKKLTDTVRQAVNKHMN